MHNESGLGGDTTSLVSDPGSVVEIAAAVAAWRVGIPDLLAKSLHRIDAVEQQVRAWCLVDRNGALAQARLLDEEARAGNLRSPLHGVPIAVKDVIDVRDLPTRANSATRAHAPVPTIDAHVVAKLRALGAIVLGKVETTEFAYFDGPPPTRNPWNLAHTPGGSSAGPAAAVASGMAPISLGTQTAGSVSRPAAYCGIAAFKPSTGAWSSFGLIPFSPSFDTIGVFGYRVADAVAVARALMPPFLSLSQPKSPLRIGLIEDRILQNGSNLVLQAVEAAAQKLRDSGIEVQRRVSNVSFADLTGWHKIVTEYELARAHPALANVDSVAPALREAVQRGATIEQSAYERAFCAIRVETKRLWENVADFDALLFPAAPDVAPKGMKTGDPSFIVPFTALGGPIVSVPIAIAPQRLPLGLMLIGAPGRDLNIAGIAEELAPIIELRR